MQEGGSQMVRFYWLISVGDAGLYLGKGNSVVGKDVALRFRLKSAAQSVVDSSIESGLQTVDSCRVESVAFLPTLSV